MIKAKYKGEEIYCTKITEVNLAKCKEDSKVGHYGNIEVGKYMYWTGCNSDNFYLILSDEDIELL